MSEVVVHAAHWVLIVLGLKALFVGQFWPWQREREVAHAREVLRRADPSVVRAAEGRQG
jgi:hypothetical protein